MKKQLQKHILWFFTVVSGSLFCASCTLVGGGSERLQPADNYEVKALPEWKKLSRAESDAAYRTSSGAVVTVVTSCKRSTTDLRALTRQLVIGLRKVTWSEQEEYQAGGHEGLLSKAKGTFKGIPVHLMFFVTHKRDCVMDFTMMNPRELSEKDSQEFLTFIDTLQFEDQR